MLTLAFSAAAVILGSLMPKRWAFAGFLAAAFVLFVLQVGIQTAMGFAGTSIEESLLLFNGSWVSFLGFNLQVTYRGFAPVILALAVPMIWRLSR